MIAIDLSKQQALDADPEAIQQINFTGNLYRVRNVPGQFININTIMDFTEYNSQSNFENFIKCFCRF